MYSSLKIMDELTREANCNRAAGSKLALPSSLGLPLNVLFKLYEQELSPTAVQDDIAESYTELLKACFVELKSVPDDEKQAFVVKMRDRRKLSLHNYPALAVLSRSRRLLTEDFHNEFEKLEDYCRRDEYDVTAQQLDQRSKAALACVRHVARLRRLDVLTYLDVTNTDYYSDYWGVNIAATVIELMNKFMDLPLLGFMTSAEDENNQDGSEELWIQQFRRYRRFSASVRKLHRDKDANALALG